MNNILMNKIQQNAFGRITLIRMTIVTLTSRRMTFIWAKFERIPFSRVTFSRMTVGRMTFSFASLSGMACTKMLCKQEIQMLCSMNGIPLVKNGNFTIFSLMTFCWMAFDWMSSRLFRIYIFCIHCWLYIFAFEEIYSFLPKTIKLFTVVFNSVLCYARALSPPFTSTLIFEGKARRIYEWNHVMSPIRLGSGISRKY